MAIISAIVNNESLCVHKRSNHPPSTTKEIPAMIGTRMSNISRDKECFDKAAPDNNNALKNVGFNKNIKGYLCLKMIMSENVAKTRFKNFFT